MSSGVTRDMVKLVSLTRPLSNVSSAEEQDMLTGDETTTLAEVKAHYRDLLAQPIKEEWPGAKPREHFLRCLPTPEFRCSS